MVGMDGLSGPGYMGTGCFFHRRAFFGGPSSLLYSELPELNPDHVKNKAIQFEAVLTLAHHVACCNYEFGTNWGTKMGFIYGSLVEDYNTGYRLLCQGWTSVFCHPDSAAFLGDMPISLNDLLAQNKRWAVGLLEVGFSKYSPIFFGTRAMGLFMGLSFSHFASWPLWAILITIYAFIPQLALLNQVSMFPKVSNPWFFLYMFLFLGAYGQDLLDFILAGGTIQRWWSDQRMWMIRGTSSYLFGSVDYLLKLVGLCDLGFTVTNKAVDDEQSKRYNQGIFEFGVPSPLFVPLTMAAILNLISFTRGIAGVFSHGNLGEMFVQLFISGFVMVNCWPIYEAIILRTDRGKMPMKTTMISILLALVLYLAAALAVKI